MWRSIWETIKPAIKVIGPMLIIDIYKYVRGKFKHKKQGGDMPEKSIQEMNPIEYFIRELVAFIKKVETKNTVEIVGAVITDLLLPAKRAIDWAKPITESGIKDIIEETLDNLIGTEDDALIGPNDGALFGINIPLVGGIAFEKLTDIIIGMISGPIADAIVPDKNENQATGHEATHGDFPD